MGLVPGRFLVSPAGLAVAGSLAVFCAFAYLRAAASETLEHRLVSRALDDLRLDKDVKMIAVRLRGAHLRGRTGLRRDVAARCLEGAGRHRRLEARLRREAEQWIRRTRDELTKEEAR